MGDIRVISEMVPDWKESAQTRRGVLVRPGARVQNLLKLHQHFTAAVA